MERFLNAKSAAQFLDLPYSTVWAFAHDGRLPGYQIGRRWVFRPSELTAWIQQQSNQRRVDVRTGRVRPVASVLPMVPCVPVSPTGDRVAGPGPQHGQTAGSTERYVSKEVIPHARIRPAEALASATGHEESAVAGEAMGGRLAAALSQAGSKPQRPPRVTEGAVQNARRTGQRLRMQ